MRDGLHVVLGSGPVGLATVEALHARGAHVRLVNRRGSAPFDLPARVEVVAGDLTDPDSTAAATQGAAVIYALAHPAFQKWDVEFPAMHQAVCDAAAHQAARLVVFEEMYAYGRPQSATVAEDHPLGATTRKGRVRAQLTRAVLDEFGRGRIEGAIGRAPDYFGPRTRVLPMFGTMFIRLVLDGKRAYLLGDLDTLHTYAYLPDLADGLVTLGERDEALGSAWHLPCLETRTTREVAELFYRAAGTRPDPRPTPKRVMRVMGFFRHDAREAEELEYLFDEPFVVDDSRFRRTFGAQPTDLEVAVKHTVEWYRLHPAA